MGKQWARQQVKTNELESALATGADWIRLNRATAGWLAAGVVVALLVAGTAFYRSSQRTDAAWNELSLAESLAYSGYHDRALQEIKTLSADYPGTPAEAFAQLFSADAVHFPRGRYQEAADAYGKVLEKGEPKPLQPLALNGLGIALEAAGKLKEAVSTQQRFLDTYPDHFLAPESHASLARSLAALGQSEQARAALQKISLQYPDTPWAAWAQRRLSGK